MNHFCPTIVIRHRKERLKKCSLRGLESRDDLQFFSYPIQRPPSFENYLLLTVDAPAVISVEDRERGLLLLDGTWKLAEKMEKALDLPDTVVRRSLPPNLKTAYPRRQDEPQGLASIEALYAAYILTDRDPIGLLDKYHWKELFLEKNNFSTIVTA